MQPQLRVRRLETWDINNHWDQIRQTAKTLYTEDYHIEEDDLTRLLVKLVSGSIQCWLVGYPGLVILQQFRDSEQEPVFEKRYLNALGFHGFKPLKGTGTYAALFAAVSAYAKKNGCEFMLARITHDGLLKRAVEFGIKQLPIYFVEV